MALPEAMTGSPNDGDTISIPTVVYDSSGVIRSPMIKVVALLFLPIRSFNSLTVASGVVISTCKGQVVQPQTKVSCYELKFSILLRPLQLQFFLLYHFLSLQLSPNMTTTTLTYLPLFLRNRPTNCRDQM